MARASQDNPQTSLSAVLIRQSFLPKIENSENCLKQGLYIVLRNQDIVFGKMLVLWEYFYDPVCANENPFTSFVLRLQQQSGGRL